MLARQEHLEWKNETERQIDESIQELALERNQRQQAMKDLTERNR